MWAGEGFCPAVQFVGLSCSSSCRNPFYNVSSLGIWGSIPPCESHLGWQRKRVRDGFVSLNLKSPESTDAWGHLTVLRPLFLSRVCGSPIPGRISPRL